MTARIPNSPELWSLTQPGAQITQPADLDDAHDVARTLRSADRSCPPCQGDCWVGADCPSRARYYGVPSREDHFEALDRSARSAWRVIVAIGLVVAAVLIAEALFPALWKWLS